MKQFLLTPAAGKRLIGKGLAAHPAIRAVLAEGTLVIIAGTTNGYVAEEILGATDQGDGFTRAGFRRGLTVPPAAKAPPVGADGFAGDVILVNGRRAEGGKTIFDVAGDLRDGDVVLKGANALDLPGRQAGVYIGDPNAGTIGATLGGIPGRRVRLIVPVGLEKRVDSDILGLCARINDPQTRGPGMMPLPGEVFTELDAIAVLTGAQADLLAGGGVHGAEGAVWIGVTGTAEQIDAAEALIQSVAAEPPCRV